MKTEEIKIRISPEEKERWRSEAKERGLSMSQYITESVNGNVPTKVESPDVPTVDVPTYTKRNDIDNSVRKEKARGAIKEIESKWGGSFFKDSKLNKGLR